MEKIISAINNSIDVKKRIVENKTLLETILKVAEEIVLAFKNDKKVLFCGNVGSAADAQHLAAELSGRFYFDREPLFAEALHVNTSYLTAVANDYSYDEVYSRLVKAKGRKGDILIGISTSGNSKNVIKAIEVANNIGMITVGMTGETGGKMKDVCKYLINVPSKDTPRIQEAHIMIGHIICEIVEKELFNG
ncbi:D-sedoheptulose-7-phosphate isomerase [Thermodesulfatator autotrophicus]|uniref:Phosphoheptose isomerase n=1 Tax=Thermodesulfatator autotrophicus TaxID=1795632 RepID=A0A177E515_9BACT|nr:D-sedoheptulose 7-phosphate isomerase [Thermodesulfatator autotrophicus]OAG27044.1 phosphoheptose isomerase [Thermodesulfatator autotrophicus]